MPFDTVKKKASGFSEQHQSPNNVARANLAKARFALLLIFKSNYLGFHKVSDPGGTAFASHYLKNSK